MGERLSLTNILKGGTPNGFMTVLHPERVFADRRGLLVEAHPDDAALSAGVVEELVFNGVGMSCLTLTHGGARKIPGLGKAVLIGKRKNEGVNASDETGMSLVVHAGLPDGKLGRYSRQGTDITRGVIEATDAEFVLVTNRYDKHPDHISAAEIALAAAGNEIPVYMMVTESTKNQEGGNLAITHVVRVSKQAVDRRKAALDKHITQTTNLSEIDQENLDNVIFLPQVLGLQYSLDMQDDEPLAAVFTHASPGLPDPIGEILAEQIIFQPELISV